ADRAPPPRHPPPQLHPPGSPGGAGCRLRRAFRQLRAHGHQQGSGNRLMASDSVERKPSVSADEGSVFSTVRNLWSYMWPEIRLDLRVRVVLADAALLASK